RGRRGRRGRRCGRRGRRRSLDGRQAEIPRAGGRGQDGDLDIVPAHGTQGDARIGVGARRCRTVGDLHAVLEDRDRRVRAQRGVEQEYDPERVGDACVRRGDVHLLPEEGEGGGRVLREGRVRLADRDGARVRRGHRCLDGIVGGGTVQLCVRRRGYAGGYGN